MTSPVITGVNGVNLQATLSAASASYESVSPHHPIICSGKLEIDLEAGEFRCPHVGVPLTEDRTRAALDHSIAILLLEIAGTTLGP